ncbi:MAG: hypothetical protein O2901_13135 [Verrucomicrobia bacterium]|nr:hypothetical protein [Verrucomicrobiota bacterium]
MIAYLILAHRSPSLVRRLISRLSTPEARFFVHIDKKVNFGPFQWALDEIEEERVFFVDRIDTRWGEYSLVEATLAGLRAAVAHRESFQHYVLLSGQSYPLANADYIQECLASHWDRSTMEYRPLPEEKRTRIERYYFSLRGWRRVYPDSVPQSGLKHRLIQKACRRILSMPRIFPNGLQPYFGSQWWCLSAGAADYVLEYVRRHPEYVRFQKLCDVPDEMFFQSIFAGADDAIRDAIDNRPFQFAIWEDGGQPSPVVLESRHFDQISASESLFARKFDLGVDSKLLDRIDNELIHV